MANSVTVNYSTAGLGTPATGEDFISGLIIYSSTLPSGFSDGTIVPMFSTVDAVSAGITNTSIGASGSTGTTSITSTGSTGAVINLIVSSLFGTTTLGSYTVASTDNTTTAASGLVTAVNALSSTTGFYAKSTTNTISVISPLSYGVGGNSSVFSSTTTGSATITGGTFTGGVASVIDPMYYEINQYFIANPTGQLFVMLQSASTASQYGEIATLQNYSLGKIRQVGVFENTVSYSSANVALLQTQATNLSVLNTPLEIFYQPNFASVTLSQLSTLVDLTGLNAQNVSVVLGQDGGLLGKSLFLANGSSYTVGQLGLFLGNNSAVPVNESVAWVGQNNMDIAGENDTLAFGNNIALASLSPNLINNINNKGYVFLLNYVGVQGSFWSNPYTCIAPTSSYSSVNNNRTIHKTARNVRAALLSFIASPVYFNPDGTIALYSISGFESASNQALAAMLSNGEISNYNTIINAKQNVLATKTVNLTVQIQPVGVANMININLGFVVNI